MKIKFIGFFKRKEGIYNNTGLQQNIKAPSAKTQNRHAEKQKGQGRPKHTIEILNANDYT